MWSEKTKKTTCMNLNSFCLSILLIAFASQSYSQKKDIVWGEIPADELAMKVYPHDTTALAVVLADYGQLYLYRGDGGYELHLIRHKRIKILDEKGLGYADVGIPFQHENGVERIKGMNAQTITASGRKIALGEKDFHTEKINESYSAIRFTFPDVQAGSILEYRYDFFSKQLYQLPDWNLQEEIPVKYSELILTNDLPLVYTTLCKSGEYMNSRALPGGGTVYENPPMRLTLQPSKYLIENAPALKEEPYTTTLEDYRISIKFQLSEIIHANGLRENFISTWEDAAKELKAHPKFGIQYLRDRFSKKIVEEVKTVFTADMSQEDKLKAVYQFLNSRLKWNEKYDFIAERNIDDVWATGGGSKAELNLLCIAVLRQLGFTAHPILVSTRGNGLMEVKFPLLSQFNYVMAGVDLGKGMFLVDLGEPLRPVGLPNRNALNYHGWLVDPDNSVVISISTPVCRDIYTTAINVSEKGALSGSFRTSFSSYSALAERRDRLSDSSADYWQKRFGNEGQLAISNATEENAADVHLPYIVKFDFEQADKDHLQESDVLYINPILYSSFFKAPFHTKTRLYPVDFPYPFEERNVISIKMPPNYAVEDMPEELNIELPAQGGGFKFTTKIVDDTIQIIGQISITSSRFKPDYYPSLRVMFNRIAEKYSEPIVLKKKS